METALLVGALALFVTASSGLVWWRLSPAAATSDRDRRAAGFDGPSVSWTRPVPPRSDEIEWSEDDDLQPAWHRLARGAALLVLVLGAATVLAIALYVAGRFVIGQLIDQFGSGLG